MAFKFEKDGYFMSAFFGPGRVQKVAHYGDIMSLSVSYTTNKDVVASFLPAPFEPTDIPTVSIWCQICKDVDILAGGGYNIVGVNLGVVYNGKRDHLTGAFALVLWENDFFPILLGRELLGAPKLLAEIPDAFVWGNSRRFCCSERGNRLIEANITDMQLVPEQAYAQMSEGSKQGHWFGWKYISNPALNNAELSFATDIRSASKIDKAWTGKGTHQFFTPKWEDAPVSSHIMAGLQKLVVKEYTGAFITHGTNDLLVAETKTLE